MANRVSPTARSCGSDNVPGQMGSVRRRSRQRFPPQERSFPVGTRHSSRVSVSHERERLGGRADDARSGRRARAIRDPRSLSQCAKAAVRHGWGPQFCLFNSSRPDRRWGSRVPSVLGVLSGPDHAELVCDPDIRGRGRVGDLVFGFAGNDLSADNRLIYVARVTHRTRRRVLRRLLLCRARGLHLRPGRGRAFPT